VKGRHESTEKTKPKHLLRVTSVIFRSNKIRPTLETYSTKAVAVGEDPNATAILQLFSKNTHF